MKNAFLKLRLIALWAICCIAVSAGDRLSGFGHRYGVTRHPLGWGYQSQLKGGIQKIDSGHHPWQGA